jgi:NADH-quinone oxidoreductase subunit M
MSILLWLFITPFILSVLILVIPSSQKNLRSIAICMSCIPLFFLAYVHQQWIGMEIEYNWFPSLSITFHLLIDSISLLFLYLTAIITPISLFAMRTEQLHSIRGFYALLFILEGFLIGFFTSHDLVFFTLFWEAMLLPIYFIITIWGGGKRQEAALQFLIYMIAGSCLLIFAVLSLYFAAISIQGKETFNFTELASISSQAPYSGWICAIFLLAFAVKTPLFPFHAWLPDTYYHAPLTGTILLSGVLSKAGIYGFYRIGIGFFPTFIEAWSPVLLTLAITGVLYGALAAWMQNDAKMLIAYSSLSHVNFILVGLFIWDQTAHTGALLQAFNHGITITALFLAVGWLADRMGTTTMGNYSGLAQFFPVLCWTTLFFVFSAVALPGTNNFIGEFMILFGLFGLHPWATLILGSAIILSVVYMLFFMRRIYFETPQSSSIIGSDLQKKEFLVAVPLIALILWVGIYPKPILKQIELSTEKMASIDKVERKS